jgi:hypothetical protein
VRWLVVTGAVAAFGWLTFADHSQPERAEASCTPIVASAPATLPLYLKQDAAGVCHPLIYRVRLTAQADAVADSFVYDEYVLHDCKALKPLTYALPGWYGLTVPTLYAIRGATTPAACALSVDADRENHFYLVRGSRVVEPDCVGGPVIWATLEANECLKYVTIDRWHTRHVGYECDGTSFEVFLRQYSGRWYVIAEQLNKFTTTQDGCLAWQTSYWKRRIPWRRP